ncbi:hypothetical protein G7054_g1729 [Neopestalotiopsis clavispora]|nr:hypothetical protein G7054_g1729 [Neopestalotiopsis clavispora]
MSVDPFDLSSYDHGIATQSNQNFGNAAELWTEWYCDPSDDLTRIPAAVSVPSPVGSNLSNGFNPSLDLAMKSTVPRNASIDTGIFSPVATESTAATTVDGDEKDGNGIGDVSGDRKRRKSSAGSKMSARDEGHNNTQQHHGVRRKSMTEPARRERNRTAAAKCRAKGKVAEEELKETQRIERDRNMALRATVEELNNESIMLKHELLCHADCNHPMINKYLSRAAEQISRGVALSRPMPQGNFGLPNL